MADFQYDPVEGWNNETEFPDYPQASEVRPLFQKLFDQIRDAFNTHKADDTKHAPLKADILNTVDLNTKTGVGLQGITNNNCPNSPTGSNGYWYILNLLYGISAIKQIAFGYLDNKMYTRYLYNAVWSAWEQVITSSGGTMSGELNMADNLLTRPYLKDYAEVIGTTPATTGTCNFDLTTGNVFAVTPTGAITIGAVNPPANGRAGSVTIWLTNGATVYAKTFVAAIKWIGDEIPDMSEANKTYGIVLTTLNGGTTYRAACIGPYSA
jgi:hypothetical protein